MKISSMRLSLRCQFQLHHVHRDLNHHRDVSGVGRKGPNQPEKRHLRPITAEWHLFASLFGFLRLLPQLRKAFEMRFGALRTWLPAVPRLHGIGLDIILSLRVSHRAFGSLVRMSAMRRSIRERFSSTSKSSWRTLMRCCRISKGSM